MATTKRATGRTVAKKAKPSKSKSTPTSAATRTSTPSKSSRRSKTTPMPRAASRTPVRTNKTKPTAPQAAMLAKLEAAGEAGYLTTLKTELRTLDALLTRKLVRRIAKGKNGGPDRHTITAAGRKILATPAPEATKTLPSS